MPAEPPDRPFDRLLFLGDDENGTPLEVMAVELMDDSLTPEAEAELLAEAEAGYDPDELVPRKTAGRPSLSAAGGTSHRINVRVDDEIYNVLQRVARESGRRPSELVREVLRAAYGPKS